MPARHPVVLITRPLKQARAFAARLDPGTKTIIAPVLEIRFRQGKAQTGKYEALVLTSANAAEAASRWGYGKGMTAFAVGKNTADAAALLGFDVVSADGTSNDLIELIAMRRPRGRLLHICGLHRAGNLAEGLRNAEIETDTVIGYEQAAIPLSPEARAILSGNADVVAPLFSPRSAALLGRQVEQARAPLHLVAISQSALAGWSGVAPASTRLAAAPNGDAMLDAVKQTLRRIRQSP